MVDDADSNRPPSVESGSGPSADPGSGSACDRGDDPAGDQSGDPSGDPSGDAAGDPAEPPADLPDDVPAPRSRDESTALLVSLKPSAVRGNDAAATYAATHGERLRYASREEAERVAGVLTRAGAAPVRLQAAAPQDPEGVDAYLVGASRADESDPGGDPAEGWTFGVSANQLGAVGEALVLGRASSPPALRHYVARELDRPPGSFELAVEAETDPVRTPDGNGSPSTDRRSPCRRRTVPTTPRTVDPSTAARVPATNRRTFARRLPSDVRARRRRARRRPPPGAGGRRRGDRRPAPPAL
jgi:hypothetical protein